MVKCKYNMMFWMGSIGITIPYAFFVKNCLAALIFYMEISWDNSEHIICYIRIAEINS